MDGPQPDPGLGPIARLVRSAELAGLTDAELLDRALREREGLAFEVLLARHASLVLGTCRRILGHEQDAEDAAQATFLVLTRKGATLGRRQSLAGWLCTVARRISCKARRAAWRRRAIGGEPADVAAPEALPPVAWREVGEA